MCWKYALYAISGTHLGSRINRGELLFLSEVITHFLQMVVYVAFIVVFMHYYGLPFYILHDVYAAYMAFRERLKAYLEYRRLVSNFDIMCVAYLF